MTFNPNIPQPNDIPSQSQAQILTNFQQLNTVFDVDHVPFNDGTAANRGKHDQSTYIELGADPTTLSGELAVYSKDNAGATTLYLRQESNGSVIQMSGPNPTPGASGTTFLPGGLLLKWGILNNPTDSAVVTFPDGGFPSNAYSLTFAISRNGTSSTVTYYTGLTNTQFTVRTNSASNDALTYIAIGD